MIEAGWCDLGTMLCSWVVAPLGAKAAPCWGRLQLPGGDQGKGFFALERTEVCALSISANLQHESQHNELCMGISSSGYLGKISYFTSEGQRQPSLSCLLSSSIHEKRLEYLCVPNGSNFD